MTLKANFDNRDKIKMDKKARWKNILIWATRTVLIFVAGLVLAAAFYENTDLFQRNTRESVNKGFKNYVVYKRADLTVFPAICLVLKNVSVKVPDRNHIAIESLKIYPRFLSLLRGSFKVKKFILIKPEILFDIPPKSQTGKEKKLPPKEIMENVNSVIKEICLDMPGLITVIKNGSLIVRKDNQNLADVKKLSARVALEHQNLKIMVKGEMEKWGRISLVGKFYTDKESIFINDLFALFGQSSVSQCLGKIMLNDTVTLQIKAEKAIFVLEDIFYKLSLFKTIRGPFAPAHNIKGRITLSPLYLSGPLYQPRNWEITAQGSLKDIVYYSTAVPELVKITQGQIRAGDNKINLDNFEVSVFDSTFGGSAQLESKQNEICMAEIKMDGVAGNNTLDWIFRRINFPPGEALRAPLKVSNLHILWNKDEKILASGSAFIKNGPTIFVNLRKDANTVVVNNLKITDKESNADISLYYAPKLITLSFKGNINARTLSALFERPSFQRGWIKGDFYCRLHLDQYEQSAAKGKLEGKDFVLHLPANETLKVGHVVLTGKNKQINLDSAELVWNKNNLNAKGLIQAAREGLIFDVKVKSDALKVEDILNKLFQPDEQPKEKKTKTQKVALRGGVRLSTPQISWGKYNAKDVTANIMFADEGVHLVFQKGRICEINIPGRILFLKERIQFKFYPFASGDELNSVLNCLFEKDLRITGNFDFKAEINSSGKADDLKRVMRGSTQFQSREGVIYRAPLLAKIFAFLNLTELLRGKLPDFTTEGFKYNTIDIKGDINQGVLVIQEAIVDGTTMQLVGEGEIDLITNQINLKVLVAPFKTIDFLVSKIPVVSYILQGSLISIPLKVTGDITNPTIVILSPSAIGEGLLGLMKRTIALPVKVMEPIIPKDKKE